MELRQIEMLKKTLRKYGTCDVKVGGSSMWPFIRQNDLITIVSQKKIPGIGSVVAFFLDKQLIIHRVVWKNNQNNNGQTVFVMGDSSPFSLAKIDVSNIIGQVINISRNGRFHKLWLSSPWKLCVIPFGFFLQILVFIKNFFIKKP